MKSLLSYAHKLGYMPFTAGVAIKVRLDQSQARLAQRIIEPVDVQLLIRAARSQRDRVLGALSGGSPKHKLVLRACAVH